MCGGSSKPSVCDKRDDLSKSVDNLIAVNPVSDGKDEVKNRLNDVKDATTAFADAAGDQFHPQIEAFKSATAAVRADVNAFISGSSSRSQALQELTNDLPKMKSTWTDLNDAVGSTCK